MGPEYKEAEGKLKQITERLTFILGVDGEDITYFNHGAIDDVVVELLAVKALMAVGEITREG